MEQGTGVGVAPPGVAVAGGGGGGTVAVGGAGGGGGVTVAVGGTGVGVPPPPGVMVSHVAETGPQVSKPWNWLTPRPRTKMMCVPTGMPVVLMVAWTATVWLP